MKIDYEQQKKCYECVGYSYWCPMYESSQIVLDNGLCIWRKIVEEDLQKIREGNLEKVCLEHLPQILKEKSVEE